MKVEVIDIIKHFAYSSFKVEGVYNYGIKPENTIKTKTSPYPGFIFTLEGNANIMFNGTPYNVKPVRVIHGGSNMDLEGKIIGKKIWNYILVLYSIKDSKNTGFKLEDSHFEINIRENKRLVDLLVKLWTTSKKPGAVSVFQKETLFRSVLEEMFKSASNKFDCDDELVFKDICSYIESHYMEDLSVSFLAECFNMNLNKLFYIFSKYAGMGAGDYLLMHRLNKAKDFLVTSDMSIINISKSVGYNDPYYFSRIFKKQIKISPSKFRELYR